MAFTQKSSSVSKRDEGEFPQLPELTEAQMKGWWSNTVAVLDRVRDKIGEIEETTGEQALKTTLHVKGQAVGTMNEQELYNKTTDGGYF